MNSSSARKPALRAEDSADEIDHQDRDPISSEEEEEVNEYRNKKKKISKKEKKLSEIEEY